MVHLYTPHTHKHHIHKYQTYTCTPHTHTTHIPHTYHTHTHKSVYCPCRGPKFVSWHPQQLAGSQLPVPPVPGDLMILAGFCVYLHSQEHTLTQTYTCMHNLKQIFRAGILALEGGGGDR